MKNIDTTVPSFGFLIGTYTKQREFDAPPVVVNYFFHEKLVTH